MVKPMTSKNGIKIRAKKPVGWCQAKLFAKRLGIATESIHKAVRAEKITKDNIVYVPEKPGSKRMSMYIYWEAVYPDYIKRWAKSKWPKWYTDPYNFEMPQSTGPQMQVLRREADARKQAEIDESKNKDKIGSSKGGTKIADMSDAVLEEKRLKVEKLQIEMDREKNKLIDIDISSAVMLEAAQATRQGFTSLIPRLSPLLTAETDQHKVTKILQEEFDNVLSSLAQLEKFTPEDSDGK